MKKHLLLFTIFICLFLAACSAKPDSLSGGFSGSSSPSVSSMETALSGDLKFADGKEGGFSTEDGYYYVVMCDDGNLNIKYLDYTTNQEIYLCNKPNCEHSDETCTSWIRANALIPSIMVTSEHLYIIHGGINANGEPAESLPHIEVMDLNGANRKLIFQETLTSEFSTLITDGSNIYTLQTKTVDSSDNIEVVQDLIRINLTTGKKDILCRIPGITSYIIDPYKDAIYLESFFLKENAQTSADIIVKLYAYKPSNSELVEIGQFDPNLERIEFINQGSIYSIDVHSFRVSKRDIDGNNETTLCEKYTDDTTARNINISDIIENRLIINDIRGQGDSAKSVTTVLDLNTGILTSWPLYFALERASQPQNVRIAAVLPDQYLVVRGGDTLNTNYENEGTATLLTSNFALIEKDDFWQGIANYKPFTKTN